MKKNLRLELIAAIFILLFMYTALSKLMDYTSFRFSLSQSPLIGRQFAPLLAHLLPYAEIGISLLLFIPQYRRLGMWLSLVTMILFTTYLVYMIFSAPHLPCSCGGVIKNMTWKQHIFFNSFFILLAIFALLKRRERNLKTTEKLKFTSAVHR